MVPKTRPPCTPGFRRQRVERVRAGRDPVDLAREFEPAAPAIRNGGLQADQAEGRREKPAVAAGSETALDAACREGLAWLRRGAKPLRVERGILS